MEQKNIRNFAIIAHVDHGKSTLSDRLLEITDTIPQNQMREQFLDQNPISRERGITIKLAPVRMCYKIRNPKSDLACRQAGIRNKSEIQNSNDQNKMENGQWSMENSDSEYILNLIDTPGHVDFSYEVSRTLAACEGAVLLIDATQNIQAQTVAHYNTAKKLGLKLIPAVNKIDLPNSDIEATSKSLREEFGFLEEEIVYVSAKTGQNVDVLLKKIAEKIPFPSGVAGNPLRALIFDAFYDEHRGVIAYIRVVDGEVKKGENIEFFQNKVKTQAREVGFFSPYLKESEALKTGEIGYIVTGIKDIRQCRVGDTLTISNLIIEPLAGYKLPKPMVFYGIYPKDSNDFVSLRRALDKLCLNDDSLTFAEEHSVFLGSGFRVGFLGLLHAEIVKERLEREDGLDLLLTMPQVLYKKDDSGNILEPYIELSIYSPQAYTGNIISLCQKKKGTLLDLIYHNKYAVLNYSMPYSLFIRGFSSELKSISSGFASLDYEISDYKIADLVNLEIMINQNKIDILSELVYRDEAYHRANEKVEKLKDSLPKKQFKQIIQATVNGKIIARGEVSPFRKDVLKKMSGGDRTRKDKLLDKQKKGKKKMLSVSKIDIPQEAINSMLES